MKANRLYFNTTELITYHLFIRPGRKNDIRGQITDIRPFNASNSLVRSSSFWFFILKGFPSTWRLRCTEQHTRAQKLQRFRRLTCPLFTMWLWWQDIQLRVRGTGFANSRIRVNPELEWLVFIQTDVAASPFTEIKKFKKGHHYLSCCLAYDRE